jgi:DNA processing protein
MQWQTSQEVSSIQQSLFQDLTEEERQICNLLDRQSPMIIDKVYKVSPFPISKTSTILLELELKNVVKVLPGKMYILI